MTQDIAIPKLTGQEDFRTWAVLLELVFTESITKTMLLKSWLKKW
jgi:hypothetical protein